MSPGCTSKLALIGTLAAVLFVLAAGISETGGLDYAFTQLLGTPSTTSGTFHDVTRHHALECCISTAWFLLNA
jgi:hypothetical protein